jgi:AcrR family transcriptional regulator
MSARGAQARWFIKEADPPSKQSILRAALKLFVKHGLTGTNVRMIGAEAGYTNPAMFKFFASKDALALYLFESCCGRLFDLIESAATRGSFHEGLGGVLDVFLSQMDEDLEAVLFVQDALRVLWPQLPASTRRRSVLRALRGLIERGIREGAVTGYRSPDVPVAAMVGLLAQLGRMLYFGEIEGDAHLHRDELRLALTRMLAG